MAELDERIEKFMDSLGNLDAGERAQLKRNAGKRLTEARHIGTFYRVLPHGTPRYQEEFFFLVATLYPLADGGAQGNFGTSLRRARDGQNDNGLNRRIEVLLDADQTQLPFRLRQAVRLLYSKRVNIDWVQLTKDLIFWNGEERRVQQAWARAYFVE
ncbi:MAG: type I-E CRISPR-associated protein Cse2/CasB [Caldilineaceae bacterium]